MHASVRGQRDGRQHDAGSMQFRCAHLIGVLDGDRQQSGPRHHRNRIPGGTSRAGCQAGNSWKIESSGRMGYRDFEPEIGVIKPHAVQDHPDASCQGDHGALCATATGDLCCPCSQPCRTPPVHHDGCSLTQRAAKVDVTGLGDAARDIAFARLVS